jgi:cellulose synthase/poly-beta-1,6-N-acetylglucosamine synthase-like glycosyltransferase
MPSCTVIICVYKNIKALQIILDGYARQSFTDFEIIIAEDNNSEGVKQFVTKAKQQYSFPIIHLSQEDNGFQKCKILNCAIAESTTNYLIFTDGDCVPHHHFVKEHWLKRTEKIAHFGRRVMLSETFTNMVYKDSSILFHKNLLGTLRKYKCTRLDASIYLPWIPSKHKMGLWGCNWSIYKKELVKIGGFDEDYNLPSIGEDVDIEWRLLRAGLQIKQRKYSFIQYHLWHPLNYQNADKMTKMLQSKMKKAKEILPYKGDEQLRKIENTFL